eukprot:gene9245-biopygen18201
MQTSRYSDLDTAKRNRKKRHCPRPVRVRSSAAVSPMAGRTGAEWSRAGRSRADLYPGRTGGQQSSSRTSPLFARRHTAPRPGCLVRLTNSTASLEKLRANIFPETPRNHL